MSACVGKHSSQTSETGRLCPELTPWPGARLGFRGGFRSERRWGWQWLQPSNLFQHRIREMFPLFPVTLVPLGQRAGGRGQLAGLAFVIQLTFWRKKTNTSLATSHHPGKSPGHFVRPSPPSRRRKPGKSSLTSSECADLCKEGRRGSSFQQERRPQDWE